MQADLIVVPDPQSSKTELLEILDSLLTRAGNLRSRIIYAAGPNSDGRLIEAQLALIRDVEAFMTAVDSGLCDAVLGQICKRHPFGMVLEHRIRSGEAIDRAAIEREIIALKEDHPQEGAWLLGIYLRVVGLSDDQNPAA